MIKIFNITAQIYDKNDIYKQNVFMNETVMALCDSDAKNIFENIYSKTHQIIKIYSIEEISQVVA
jgi:hypothetical protein